MPGMDEFICIPTESLKEKNKSWIVEDKKKTNELPLLAVIGYTNGWPRFEASFDGEKSDIEAMNVYLEKYGYQIKRIGE
jgi:hypothetical protein